MANIDRSLLSFNADSGGYEGVVTLGTRQFDVFVKAWAGDWEAAWAKAELGAGLLLTRLSELEAAVITQLAPELDHWTDDPITVTEITQQLIQSIQVMTVVRLCADEQTARLYFGGPTWVLGHDVEVTLCRDGRVLVGLAG